MCDECEMIIVLAAEDAAAVCDLWGAYAPTSSDTSGDVDL